VAALGSLFGLGFAFSCEKTFAPAKSIKKARPPVSILFVFMSILLVCESILFIALNKEFTTTLRDFELGRRGVKEVKAQRSMVNGIYLPKRLKKRFTLKQI